MAIGETIGLIEALGNGGSSLPTVTASDNGKVLGVVDGAWAADENSFVVTYDGTTADKTYAQIREKVLAGKKVYCVYGAMVYEFSGISNFESSTSERINFASFNNSTQYYYLNFMITGQIYRGATVNIPSTTNSDNGSELIVKNGSWAKQKKKFIVTLTPTAPDYSGTMDKTVAEMTEAYNAGMQIVWRVVMSSNMYTDVNVTAVLTDEDFDYPAFNAYVIELNSGVLVCAHIPVTDDGTVQTYSTKVYSLTPAS